MSGWHTRRVSDSPVTTGEGPFAPFAQFHSELSEGIPECFSTDGGSKCLRVSEPHSVLSGPMESARPLMSWSKPLLQSQQPSLDALPQGKGIIFDNWVHDQENLLIQQLKDRLDTSARKLGFEGNPYRPRYPFRGRARPSQSCDCLEAQAGWKLVEPCLNPRVHIAMHGHTESTARA